MVLPHAFAEGARCAEALARRTSMRVGGRPRYLFEPTTEAEAAQAVLLCRAWDVPLHVLGGGSNVLVADDALDVAVLATRRLRGVEVRDDTVRVRGGTSFPGLVREAPALRIPHLSGLPGIPGTVGGAVTMNAGGRHGSISDALVAVEGVEADGRPFRRDVGPADFGYRQSPFGGALVTAAVFRRDPALDASAEATRRRRILAEKQRVQPLGARSSGCIFKNPPGECSAGRLIDEAGLKGARIGDAQVSARHANFIVNRGAATARDVHALIGRIRDEVARRFGIELELEVRLWPTDRTPWR